MKSILHLSFSLVLLLTSWSGSAQNSILWEVSGNGMTQPSYLMGTLKFMGEREFEMPGIVKEKLQTCELFAIEDQVDHHAQHELNKAIHFPKGQSLSSLLSKDDYNKVQVFFQNEFGITKKKFEKKFSKLIPLALSITMTRLSLHEGLRFYDIELLKLAKDYRIEAYSLEDIDREAQALHSFPLEAQANALLHSIDNFEVQKEEYKQLEEAYLKGNLDKVFEYSLHPFEKNEQFINEFYIKRNQEWLPKLEKMFTTQKSFIAVGVTHLKGEGGLLAMLRSKGFTLTPVPMGAE